jgi:hypothetical protein
VKEMYSYVCPDIAKEFAKYDKQPDKYFKSFSGVKVISILNPPSVLFYLSVVFVLYFPSETYWAALDL